MDNVGIAQHLALTADLLELTGANPFKVKAFAQAARTLERLETEVSLPIRQGALRSVPGIGAGLSAALAQLVATRTFDELEALKHQVPSSLVELLALPHVTPKRLRALHQRLGISSLAAYEAALAAGQLADLPGFGPKTQEKLAEGLALWKASRGHVLLWEALKEAPGLLATVQALPGVEAAELSGALRRRCETVTSVELVVATRRAPEQVRAQLAAALGSGSPEAEGGSGGTLKCGLPIQLHAVSPEAYALTLWRTTGSPEHVEALRAHAARKGLLLDERGLWAQDQTVEVKHEADLYRALGLEVPIPERREAEHSLSSGPARPLERQDLRGTFHAHTRYSDGRGTLEQMVEAAHQAGFSYFGVSDHSQAAAYANGLTLEDIDRQRAEIDRLRERYPALTILHGIEADILADGSIDYGAEGLSRFDFVIASIHSRFGMDREQMTERMVRAVRSPWVTILGHMTGRLLLAREPYAFDQEKVLAAAIAAGVVIELNASPQRLDLDWRAIPRALEMGATLSINPDAHAVESLRHVELGVMMARKGGLTPERLFNARPLDEILAHLSERKARAMQALAIASP